MNKHALRRLQLLAVLISADTKSLYLFTLS